MTDQPPLGEFELIDRYFSTSAARSRADVILGVGDDAAVLRLPAAADLVAAVDTLVAGRHFPLDSGARAVGHRALAVNLSDFAAMGAAPAWATLALTLPRADGAWIGEFSHGLYALADAHGVELVGGDTTGGPLTISVQLLGTIDRGTALRRGGAKPGDLVAVTGTLGDAGAGLALWQRRLVTSDAAAAAELIARFEYPTPRVAFGRAARGVATAAMDISDGLSGDLPKLAAASALAARVEVRRLPLSRALQSITDDAAARELALSAGDDYELLLTVPPRRFDELAAIARQLNLTLTAIGEMRDGSGVSFTFDGETYAPASGGYDHFR